MRGFPQKYEPTSTIGVSRRRPLRVAYRHLTGFVLLTVVLVALFSQSGRAGIIEQGEGTSWWSLIVPKGQSFVAEDSQLGTIAFEFRELNPEPNDPITITLYSGIGIGGPVVRSITNTLPAVLPSTMDDPEYPVQYIDFDFSGTVLSVGSVYTVAVSSTSYKAGIRCNSSSDLYPNGVFYPQNLNPHIFDLVFRITPIASVPPVLNSKKVGDNLVLSWPVQSSEFELESTDNLDLPEWEVLTDLHTTNSGIVSVTLPLMPDNKFFRLKRTESP